MDSRPPETVTEQPDEAVTAQQFDVLVRELSNWNRWGPDDQRGALNFLTTERIAAATRLVRDGRTVSLSLPLNTTPAIHCPLGEGDILLARTGHSRRLAELGPWNTPESKAGLHPAAIRFVASRAVSALGSDGNSDSARRAPPKESTSRFTPSPSP